MSFFDRLSRRPRPRTRRTRDGLRTRRAAAGTTRRVVSHTRAGGRSRDGSHDPSHDLPFVELGRSQSHAANAVSAWLRTSPIRLATCAKVGLAAGSASIQSQSSAHTASPSPPGGHEPGRGGICCGSSISGSRRVESPSRIPPPSNSEKPRRPRAPTRRPPRPDPQPPSKNRRSNNHRARTKGRSKLHALRASFLPPSARRTHLATSVNDPPH